MSLVGEVLGSYRLTEELSSGGMGTVYRAQHELLARPAAVKVLRPELTSNADVVSRFFTEARAASSIRHSGIVEVFDFGYAPDGSAYLAMELLEGQSLKAKVVAHGAFDERLAASLARDVCSALAAAHAKGIYHRDLKPDNVFVVVGEDGAEHAKVLDFGVAKLVDRIDDRKATVDGTLLGTPRYMAPEQARAASAVDHRADLYSLGCLVYEMVAGSPPFLGATSGALIAQHLFDEPERPRARGAKITPAFEAVILRLLQKEPDQRYASATATAAAIMQATTPTAAISAAMPAASGALPRAAGRGRGIAIVFAAVLVAGGGIAAAVHFASGQGDEPAVQTPAKPAPVPVAVQPAPAPAPPPVPVVAPTQPAPVATQPATPIAPPVVKPAVKPPVAHAAQVAPAHTHAPPAVPPSAAPCDGRTGAHDPNCSPIEIAP